MNLIDFFKETRAIIERGWCQGVFSRPILGGRAYCLLGAMGQVEANNEVVRLLQSAKDLLAPLLPMEFVDDGYPMVAKWNDASDRTKDDVLALLDAAIALEEEKVRDHG